MLPKHFQDLLEKFSRGACSPEEEQLITRWYNSIGKAENSVLPEEEKTRIEDTLWAAIRPEVPKKWGLLPVLSRAAIIAVPLLAGALYYFSRQPFSEPMRPRQEAFDLTKTGAHFENEGKTPQKIALSDGSEVILQPSSKLALSQDFGVSSRELRLTGEAFFQVERDERRPFVVYSNEVITKVLGTSFHVRAYENDGEITVAVKSGKVSVCTSKNKAGVSSARQYTEVILTPNQQVVYHRERELVSKRLVENPEVILPNSDLFRMQFENASVGEIFGVLEENYGVEIRYDRDLLNNCRLTTSMSDEGLYERIEVICKAIGASYVIDNDAVITIKSNGC